MKLNKVNLALGMAASLMMTPVMAQEWSIEFTPYLWGAANEGKSGGTDINGTGIDSINDIDIPFSELWDHLDIAYMANTKATKDKWMLYNESTYLSVTDEQTASAGAVEVKADIEISGYISDFGAGYRFYETQDMNLYAYAGIRFMNLDIEIDTSRDPALVGVTDGRSITLGDNWVDPLIGLHLTQKLNDNWAMQGRVEVGGFDVGSESAYLVNVTLSQKLSENWSMKYFYRYMEIDYNDNNFVYDMEVTGPGIGATYTF